MSGTKLFTREVNAAILTGLRSQKPILLRDALREEISHWLFFENWDNPIPWCDERHIQISVATDASLRAGELRLFLRIAESFLIIGNRRSSHGTLQQKKPWQLIKCCYRARMKFVTRVSMYRSITMELFTRGTTKVAGVPSVIML